MKPCRVKVVTCEGDVVEFDYMGQRRTEVPLKQIKKWKYCEILKRDIPEHFREIFEHNLDYYVESEEEYEKENYITFDRWSSVEIK